MDEPRPLAKRFFSAYKRGYHAEMGAKNPYLDHRTDRGGVTFSRYWARLWRQGQEDAAAKKPYRYVDETTLPKPEPDNTWW